MEQEPRDPSADDALWRLEERIDRASDAAERLIAEAAANASSQPPPAGWAPPGPGDAHARQAQRGDLELLAEVLRSLRDLVPPELQRKLGEALRELLLAIRALIDWYLERVEQRQDAPDEVEDIPIL